MRGRSSRLPQWDPLQQLISQACSRQSTTAQRLITWSDGCNLKQPQCHQMYHYRHITCSSVTDMSDVMWGVTFKQLEHSPNVWPALVMFLPIRMRTTTLRAADSIEILVISFCQPHNCHFFNLFSNPLQRGYKTLQNYLLYGGRNSGSLYMTLKRLYIAAIYTAFHR